MTKEEFEHGEQVNKEFLDTIDFKPWLHVYWDVSMIMDELKRCCQLNLIQSIMPPELHGEVFEYYDISDFAEYLAKRYNKHLVVDTKYELC